MKFLAVFLLAMWLANVLRAPDKAPEVFAVLPAPDGHVGTIVVKGPQSEQVLNGAYASVRIEGGSQTFSVLDAGQVRDMFGSTLDALPGVATSFTLYFVEGKDELTPESQAQLESVFAELKRRPLPDIVVIGHTDTVGSLDFNDKLSRARADRMRELLVPTEDNVSEPRNRRVEINVR